MRFLKAVKQAAATGRFTVGYVRASTDDQTITLDAQEARLRAYSAAMAWDGLEIVTDAGESAKSLQRPAMALLLARVRRGEIARVVVAKLDRLTRSLRDLSELVELFNRHGVALVSLSETIDTSSAIGRAMLQLVGVFAELERGQIAERTRDALAHQRREGKVYCGAVPFGYRREGKQLIADPDEQLALRAAVAMDRSGASYREIGRMLEARGVRPHRGVAWHASSVRAILRSRIATETIA